MPHQAVHPIACRACWATFLSRQLCLLCCLCRFFIRKLGRVLGDLERQSISEAALLKQASVLQG